MSTTEPERGAQPQPSDDEAGGARPMRVGGDYVGGNKSVTQTAGGDIVGRDKITTTYGDAEAGQRLAEHFARIEQLIAARPADPNVGKDEIKETVERIKGEAQKGEEASAAKLWHSEMQWDACDTALQLHGGAGYMNEYPIARLWRDARVARIYGGTSEIMRELIGRSLG